MKKSVIAILVLLVLCPFIFADYRSDIGAGNEAYRKGDLERALKHYESAAAKQPNDRLFSLIEKVKGEIAEKKRVERAASGKSSGPALIILDVVLCGLAVVSYFDYSASANAYEALFAEIDNSTASNYRILEYEKVQVEQKGMFMAFAAGAAGAAVLYTLADMFILNSGTSTALRPEINPAREYAGLKAEWGF
ncbi:MAG TPA: hypothetical protein ENN43_01920 [bacterium]|nr:hypothetical protein [bacterium]